MSGHPAGHPTRLLLDMNVPRGIAPLLRSCGYDAVHLGEIGLGRLPDDDVFAHAVREARMLVTFDLDFGEIVGLAAGLGSCGVVLLRLRSVRLEHLFARLELALAEGKTALEASALILVEDARIRIRSMPPD